MARAKAWAGARARVRVRAGSAPTSNDCSGPKPSALATCSALSVLRMGHLDIQSEVVAVPASEVNSMVVRSAAARKV